MERLLGSSFRWCLIAVLFCSIGTTQAATNRNNEVESNEAARSTGNISGVVLDPFGTILPGAMLQLDKENRYTISDPDGTYLFLDVPVGTYTLKVSYLGFVPYEATIVVEAGKNTTHEVNMVEAVFTTGEVVIIGELAQGQARALTTERNNRNITNMVAADQIGRFPDSNIGDALKRIPGITMQNDQGEARNIVVRGLANNLNSVTLNGGRIPSAEGDNRNIQMDLIPSDMIAMIEVNKTLLPDMEADAIGGSVNLVTKAAPRRQLISASLGGGYNDIRQSCTYQGAFAYGNRFFDEKFGAVFSLSYQNKTYGSDNIEAAWDMAPNNQPFIETFEIRKYDVQRIRRSASLNLDYAFNENHTIYFKSLYNWRDDFENRFRHRIRKVKPVMDASESNIIGYKGNLDRQTKGGIGNNRVKNTRLEDQRVLNFALSGEHLIANFMEMDWGASYSRASEHRPNERYITYEAKGFNVKQDLSDGLFPVIAVEGQSLDKYKLDEISESDELTYENEWSGKLNFRLPLSVVRDQKGRLRIGAKVNLKDKNRDNNFFAYDPVDGFPTLDQMPLVTWDNKNFLNGKGYIPGSFVSREHLGGLDLQNATLFDKEDVPEEYWTYNYQARENIYAGYFRWDQNITDKFLIITGLRVEHTAVDYIGHTFDAETGEKGPNIENKNNYTNFFPNLTFRYEPVERFVLRGAFSTSIARPNYYWLVPYTMINSGDAEIMTGNSKLKSTYAYNFDLIGTYYPGNVGQFSVGLFYKRLNDFIYIYATDRYQTQHFAEEFPSIPNPIPVGENWSYRTHRNGDNVDLFGLEVSFNRQLDFLPSFLKRLSIYLNYTYTYSKAYGISNEDGDVRENTPLPGSAPHTVNASLAYEDKRFTARLSLNHAASYLDELGAVPFEDAYYGAQTFLDFNASYKITRQLQVYLDCNNLLNTPLFYYQGSKDRLMQLEYYKPAISAGLRWNL